MEGGRIGTYTIHRKLGEGGMGTVYLGEHSLLGRRAAIKVLLPAMSANHEIVNRFFNEARATTSIADPGIVQIFDFGYHTDGSAYIVMELLDGESLEARLERAGRMRPADCIRLLRQVATSLGSAHARGIVHRDLKPDNLFIVGDPEVIGGERTKILDFGIAKLAGDEPGRMKTRTGAVMGTPMFMSPEQCRGVGTIDHRSDIYALGCVLFVCLTARPPFDGEGVGDIMFGHMGLAPPSPSTFVPGLPPAIDQLVLRCLAKQPADRFQSMHELAAAMQALEAQLASFAGSPLVGPASATIRAAPTPASSPYLAAPGTTTHSSAIGQIATTPPAARSKGPLVALVGVLAIAGIVAVALTRRGSEPAASPSEPASPAASQPVIDANATTPVIPVDAAVATAPVDAEVVIDAAVATTRSAPTTTPAAASPTKAPVKKAPKRGTSHAKQPDTRDLDRGD